MTPFDPVFLGSALALGVLSGATASIVGFGIGSLLTPFFSVPLGTDIAVAAVTLPHLVATAFRCYRLRREIDWSVVARFGLLSAAGGLLGALAYARLGPSALTGILGGLLVLTAVANLTGVFVNRQIGVATTGLLGLASGFFGGLAGNQGGLRSAALSTFALSPLGFVATSTATGLLVDLARTPVYAALNAGDLVMYWPPIGTATVGVIAGTLLGERLLLGLSPLTFRRLLAGAVGLLGLWLLWRTYSG
ncbi:MAG: sulfite exporter TauE/SafE family protein [Vicinamibacterales bacterium]